MTITRRGWKMKALRMTGALALASIPVIVSSPARADVKAGVDAWNQADYTKAIAQWQPLANAGDPDAQFNLGQAYKLGRGVPVDLPRAVEWFRKAAVQGHLRAEDNYGLLLFQQGQRDTAIPFIKKSAARGEPRAQYILGTAMFNGEIVPKDWVRAYALMTRAASSGLPQATDSLAQMDKYIPADQRQKGLAIATQMAKMEQTQLAAATGMPPVTSSAPGGPGRASEPRPPQSSSGPLRTTQLPPSQPAPYAPPPYSPAPAPSGAPGTSYMPPPEPGYPVAASRPAPVKPLPPRPAPVRAAAVAPAPRSGAWRVQLGAFSDESRARGLWSSLSGKISGLSAYQPFLVKGGAVTRLQAGPVASEAEADKLCRAIKATGNDCIPKKM